MAAIDEFFQNLTHHKPRQFQRETMETILNSVQAGCYAGILLRAPTGSGKTETAIAPFLFAKVMEIEGFPNKLIYIVPLRTLATSLRDRTVDLVKRWEDQYHKNGERKLVVTLQTGDNPEDPRFEGDIVFCTIDQLLSSFLSIPYSVGRGSANVNAGVVFASYLVFDELHLLDPDRSFATTLKLLEQAQGISPYLLMTATLTQELAQQIQQEVKPRKGHPEDVLHLVHVEEDDLAKIEEGRTRLFSPSPKPLSAEVILQDIQVCKRKRVIVICNTVAKSQGLFQNLQDLAPPNVEVTLLHSRFLPEDRKAKETSLQTIFAEGWQEKDDGTCQVLISTQVVEAGINITSEVLHTQLCPMNALLQRAGRCARFKGEMGQVLVYRDIQVGDERQALAKSEDDDEAVAQADHRPRRMFLPYADNVCEATWEVLQAHQQGGMAELAVGFAIEAGWINQVHGEEDRAQAGKRSQRKSSFETDFDDAVFRGKTDVAKNLIRYVDSRSVFMVADSTIIDLDISDEVDVKQLQPFSLPRTTLCKIWRDYLDSHDQTWLFKKVVPAAGEGYALPQAQPIQNQRDLLESIRLVVNPRYVSYDEEIGLQIGVHIDGHYQSPKQRTQAKVNQEYRYQMDTYLGHLGRMWTCWERDFEGELLINGQLTSVTLASSSGELCRAGGRFIARKIFPQTTLAQTTALFELLVFLAVITHDLGKLQRQWQSVMQGWQQIAHQYFKGKYPGSHLLAHTDFDPSDRQTLDTEGRNQRESLRAYERQNRRPPHAVESAFLSYEILEAVLIPVLQALQATETQMELICHTVEMAAGRHHSAWAKGWEESKAKITLHPQANTVIQQSWQRLSKRLTGKLALPQHLPKLEPTYAMEEFALGKKIREDDLTYQQLYWLVVRALRICDGRSVQLH